MRKKTRLERALERCLTPEQYARKTHTTPYLYTIGNDEGALTFVGAHHTVNPTDPLLDIIDEVIQTKQPHVVFVEGMQNITGAASNEKFINGLSREDAVRRGGESVYTAKQAIARGIPWQSPEPSDAAVARALTSSFYSRTQILAWYVLRLLAQYHRREETMPFSAYAAPFLVDFQRQTDWANFDYTLESALETASQTLGHTVNINNNERAGEYTDPIPWPDRWEFQTPFNDMTRVVLSLRDRTIVRQVAKELMHGRRVLVVYGAGHAVMQEPSWEFFLGKNT